MTISFFVLKTLFLLVTIVLLEKKYTLNNKHILLWFYILYLVYEQIKYSQQSSEIEVNFLHLKTFDFQWKFFINSHKYHYLKKWKIAIFQHWNTLVILFEFLWAKMMTSHKFFKFCESLIFVKRNIYRFTRVNKVNTKNQKSYSCYWHFKWSLLKTKNDLLKIS